MTTTIPSSTTTATAHDRRTETQPKTVEVKTSVVVVKGGKPEGGIKKLEYKKGDQVRFVVRSDVADEIHVHGYDFKKDVPAGGSVQLQLPGEHRGRVRDRARGPQGADRRAARARPRETTPRRAGSAAAARWPRRSPCPRSPLAHGLVGRADLPIPEWLFGWAAAVVLVVSFVGLATLWQEPKLEGDSEFRPAAGMALLHARQPAPPRSPPALIGVGLLGADRLERASPACRPRPANFDAHVHLRDLLGRAGSGQRPVRRRVPGVQPLARDRAAPAGSSRHGSPGPLPTPFTYPAWLGRWPAAATIFGFAWIELAWVERPATRARSRSRRSSTAAITLLAIAVLRHRGMDPRGEGFSVYYNLFSRISRGRGRATAGSGCRRPLSALTRSTPVPGTVAMLVVMLGTVAFDGASEGPQWSQHRAAHPGLLRQPRASAPATRSSSPSRRDGDRRSAVIAAIYLLGIVGVRTVDRRPLSVARAHVRAHARADRGRLRDRPLLLVPRLQRAGDRLPRLRPARPGIGPVRHGRQVDRLQRDQRDAASGTCRSAVLVAGHVGGLVLAHDRALALYEKAARRDPVAVLDARGDGRLHDLRPVAAVAGEPVIVRRHTSRRAVRPRRACARRPADVRPGAGAAAVVRDRGSPRSKKRGKGRWRIKLKAARLRAAAGAGDRGRRAR